MFFDIPLDVVRKKMKITTSGEEEKLIADSFLL
jgi:hypothetical protein